VTTRSDVVR